MPEPAFSGYSEFFPFYLSQHSHPRNRLLHATGTSVSLVFVVAVVATHHAWYALMWPVIGYSFAWAGHFLVERNRPATFGHPFWSFAADFHMLWLMLTGRIEQEMTRAQIKRVAAAN